MGLRAYLVRNTEFLAIEAAFYKDHNRIRHRPPAEVLTDQ